MISLIVRHWTTILPTAVIMSPGESSYLNGQLSSTTLMRHKPVSGHFIILRPSWQWMKSCVPLGIPSSHQPPHQYQWLYQWRGKLAIRNFLLNFLTSSSQVLQTPDCRVEWHFNPHSKKPFPYYTINSTIMKFGLFVTIISCSSLLFGGQCIDNKGYPCLTID